jgi:hypothetical protein
VDLTHDNKSRKTSGHLTTPSLNLAIIIQWILQVNRDGFSIFQGRLQNSISAMLKMSHKPKDVLWIYPERKYRHTDGQSSSSIKAKNQYWIPQLLKEQENHHERIVEGPRDWMNPGANWTLSCDARRIPGSREDQTERRQIAFSQWGTRFSRWLHFGAAGWKMCWKRVER